MVPQPIYSDKDVKIADHLATIFGVSYPDDFEQKPYKASYVHHP